MKLQAIVLFPLICAFIGYSTKWIALQMVFKPNTFVGVGPIGWQGIIQRQSAKFSVGIAQTLQNAGLDASILVDQVDGDELAAALASPLADSAPDLARMFVDALAPGTWAGLTEGERADAIAMVTAEAGPMPGEVADIAVPRVATGLDVGGLVSGLLSGENAHRLAYLFRAIGGHELRWMIRYGAIMGFVIGLVEVGVYAAYGHWWMLAIIGAADGLVNNWLALQMIFLPRERTVYLGVFPYQGMFPARQKEISANFARVVAEEVLTPSTVVARLNQSGALTSIASDVLPLVSVPIDAFLGRLAKMVRVDAGPGAAFAALGALSGPDARAVLEPLVIAAESYFTEAVDFETLLETGLAAMPKEDFENVLRGIFKEDENILICLGGVIGAGIGSLQALIAVSFHFV